MLIMSNGYHFNHIALFYLMQSFDKKLKWWDRDKAAGISRIYADHC